MSIFKTFLGGTFLAAAGLNLLTAALGLKGFVISISTLLPAISVGDLIEAVGAVTLGFVASVVSARRRAAQ